MTLLDKVGILMDLKGVWHRSDKFIRKNVIRVLCREGITCVPDTWFKREGRRKVTFRMGENETEIDFVLIKNL